MKGVLIKESDSTFLKTTVFDLASFVFWDSQNVLGATKHGGKVVRLLRESSVLCTLAILGVNSPISGVRACPRCSKTAASCWTLREQYLASKT
jgi:hypothetical protein